MDRHLTYVAMTRHREEAALYASREEFSSLSALSARLGRSHAKETTLDYAERRGIAGQFGVESQIEVLRGPAEQRRQSLLALARSVLAPEAPLPGAAARPTTPGSLPPAPVDPAVAAAVERAKEAYRASQAVEQARLAYEAEQARQSAIEAERLRLAQKEAEAAQKLEQERAAERARPRSPSPGRGR
jgi:hypothetical protein